MNNSKRVNNIKLIYLAKSIGDDFYIKSDQENKVISNINSIDKDTDDGICFVWSKTQSQKLKKLKKNVVVLTKDLINLCNTNYIVCKNPQIQFIKVAKLLFAIGNQDAHIADTAIIAKDAKIGKNVSIGAYSVIQNNCIIGDNTTIGNNCTIESNCIFGNNTQIDHNVSIYKNTQIAQNVIIGSGCVISSDGFGYTKDNNQWLKLPHIGGVIIGKNTQIGSNCTIDKGKIDDTIIGENVIIDNLVHIGHNVKIGDRTAIAGACAIGGSVEIGKDVQIGGASAVFSHKKIADKAVFTIMSSVYKNIKIADRYTSVNNLIPHSKWLKNLRHTKND